MAKLETGAKTVLIVDDEPEIRDFVCRVADICGWQSRESATGDGIVAVMENDPSIALIILDVNMPGVDGIEAILKLGEQQGKDIPVCIISGGSEINTDAAEKLARFQGIEIVQILQKPFAIEDIKLLLAQF